MRLEASIAAYPAWLAPSRPALRGNAKGGVPLLRPGAVVSLMAQRRVALGLTQAQVADRLGIARESVSRAENRVLYRSRRDARAVRTRGRLNAFYLALERVQGGK